MDYEFQKKLVIFLFKIITDIRNPRQRNEYVFPRSMEVLEEISLFVFGKKNDRKKSGRGDVGEVAV